MRVFGLLLVCLAGAAAQHPERMNSLDRHERERATEAFIGTGVQSMRRGLASKNAEVRLRCRELARSNPYNLPPFLLAAEPEALQRVASGEAEAGDLLALCRWGAPARPLLLEHLDAENPLCGAALRGLAGVGSSEDVARVAAFLGDPQHCRQALRTLAALQPVAGPALRAAVQACGQHAPLEVRVQSWLLLARWGDAQACEQAIEVLQEEAAAFPRDPWPQRQLAELWRARGASETALVVVAAALAEHPEDTGLLRLQARLYQEQGALAEAAACYQTVLQLQPGDAGSLYRLGLLQHRLGASRQGLERVFEAAEAGLPLASAYGALASILASGDDADPETAVLWAAQALELRPGEPALLGIQGVARLAAGHALEASLSLRQAVAGFEARAHFRQAHSQRCRLARALLALDQPAEARELAERVRRDDPHNPHLAELEQALGP